MARAASVTSSTRNPVDAVLDRLGERAGAAGDDRRPGRHRLDRDEPERLRPAAEHHRREGAGVQRVALERPDLAQELDSCVVDRRLHDLVEVLLLARVVNTLAATRSGTPGPAAELDRVAGCPSRA